MATITGISIVNGGLVIPDGSITNVMIGSSGATSLQGEKVEHQFPVGGELFAPTTSVAALTTVIHGVYGSASEVVAILGVITGAIATDVSRTISVDLKKSTGAGAYATILSSPMAFTSSSTLRSLGAQGAVISTPNMVAGDSLELVVTVAGGSGSQATGLAVFVIIRELPTP